MKYRTILVHFADERRLPDLLQVALALGEGVRLIGLAVLPPIIVVPDADGVGGATIEEHREAYAAQMARMRDAFGSATRAAGVDAHWEEADGQIANPFGTVASLVIERARSADLVVTAQANPAWGLSGMLDVGEQLVVEGGRPVLLIPRLGPTAVPPTMPAKRILLAWNGSREAARAAFDAMALLTVADEVVIVRLHPDLEHGVGDASGVREITAALARHGVKTTSVEPVHLEHGDGYTLLALARNHGCDLLVMGCYGHARWREFLMGGASRHVLDHMELPVLMSH